MPLIQPYKGIWPTIADDAFIAENAVIIGDVHIGAEAGIWYNVVIRGDVNHIRIGARTNVQDGTVIHVTRKIAPTLIGSGVTIGHKACLHGCIIEDNAFIGMNTTILDFATIKSGGMLAAGAMLAPKKTLPAGEIWAGNPAKKLRDMTQDEKDFIPVSAENYRLHTHEYREREDTGANGIK